MQAAMSSQRINDLMRRVSKRDPNAFSALYDLCSDDIYRQCLSLLTQPEDAEDAMHDVFVKLWDKGTAYDHKSNNAKRYIATVARNHCTDLLRRQALRRVDSAKPPEEGTCDTNTGVEKRVDFSNALKLLYHLAPSAREIISLQLVQGLSFPEIARKMGIPEPTAKSRSRRALATLRKTNCESSLTYQKAKE
jgi:RNA polymerase sigma-70 factor, ECF subfamily